VSDTYDILASISAVLSGFSLAFLGVILAISGESRAADRTAKLSTVSALVFLIAALGWSLTGSQVAPLDDTQQVREFLRRLRGLHRTLSILFLLGVGLFMATLASSGWIRSRSVGRFTALTSAAGFMVAVWVLSHFIQ
jgi:hypothetical protein